MSTYADPRNFSDLPEPPKFDRAIDDEYGRKTGQIADPYLTGLEKYIAALGAHITQIQNEEARLMSEFQAKLRSLGDRTDDELLKEESQAIDRFKERIVAQRRRRREFREMKDAALQQRQFFLDSMILQREQNEYLRGQLYKLSALPKDEAPQASRIGVSAFGIVAFILQIIFIILFATVTDFERYDLIETVNELGFDLRIANFYSFLVDIALFALIGFGFLLAFLRKYGFSAIGYTLLLTAFTVQWTILVVGFFLQVEENLAGNGFSNLTITMRLVIESFYGVVAVLITFGALAGKISIFSMLLLAFIEIMFYGLNLWICRYLLDAIDIGRSMYTHVFGAVFGLAAAILLTKPYLSGRHETRDYNSSYRSDIFAMIGTIFLFVLFPSFNAALAPNGTQYRVVINTLLAICVSVLFAFLMSRTFRGRLFDMTEVQNASIAGGVAMGSSMSVIIEPGAAMIVGAIAGTASAIGFAFIQPYMHHPDRKVPVHDTRGVLSLHLIPGLIGAIGGFIATAVAASTGVNSEIYGQPFASVFNTTGENQAGYQCAALLVTIGIAFLGGILSGLIFWFFERSRLRFFLFSDQQEWQVPSDFERLRPVEVVQ